MQHNAKHCWWWWLCCGDISSRFSITHSLPPLLHCTDWRRGDSLTPSASYFPSTSSGDTRTHEWIECYTATAAAGCKFMNEIKNRYERIMQSMKHDNAAAAVSVYAPPLLTLTVTTSWLVWFGAERWAWSWLTTNWRSEGCGGLIVPLHYFRIWSTQCGR